MPQMNKGGKFIFGKSLIRTEHCGFHRRQWKKITLQMKEKYISLKELGQFRVVGFSIPCLLPTEKHGEKQKRPRRACAYVFSAFPI